MPCCLGQLRTTCSESEVYTVELRYRKRVVRVLDRFESDQSGYGSSTPGRGRVRLITRDKTRIGCHLDLDLRAKSEWLCDHRCPSWGIACIAQDDAVVVDGVVGRAARRLGSDSVPVRARRRPARARVDLRVDPAARGGRGRRVGRRRPDAGRALLPAVAPVAGLPRRRHRPRGRSGGAGRRAAGRRHPGAPAGGDVRRRARGLPARGRRAPANTNTSAAGTAHACARRCAAALGVPRVELARGDRGVLAPRGQRVDGRRGDAPSGLRERRRRRAGLRGAGRGRAR